MMIKFRTKNLHGDLWKILSGKGHYLLNSCGLVSEIFSHQQNTQKKSGLGTIGQFAQNSIPDGQISSIEILNPWTFVPKKSHPYKVVPYQQKSRVITSTCRGYNLFHPSETHWFSAIYRGYIPMSLHNDQLGSYLCMLRWWSLMSNIVSPLNSSTRWFRKWAMIKTTWLFREKRDEILHSYINIGIIS